LAVDRSCQSVDDAAEQLFADRNRESATTWENSRTRSDTVSFRKWHENQAFVAKSDDLSRDTRCTGAGSLRIQMADLTQRQAQTLHLDAQSDDLHHAALKAEAGGARDQLAVGRQIKHRSNPA